MLLIANERQSTLQFSRKVGAFSGYVNGFARLLPQPSIQFLWRGRHESSLSMYRHPLCCPTLDDWGGMSQEGRDLLPALQGFGLSRLRGRLFRCLSPRVHSETIQESKEAQRSQAQSTELIRLKIMRRTGESEGTRQIATNPNHKYVN